MTSKAVDRIDPFHNKASIKGRKQKRSQGSSHYRTKGPSELTALPQLKGVKSLLSSFVFRPKENVLYFIINFKIIFVQVASRFAISYSHFVTPKLTLFVPN